MEVVTTRVKTGFSVLSSNTLETGTHLDQIEGGLGGGPGDETVRGWRECTVLCLEVPLLLGVSSRMG